VRSRPRAAGSVVAACVAASLAGCAAGHPARPAARPAPAPPAAPAPGRSSASALDPARALAQRLLDARARAVREHDQAAFLVTVDPSGGPALLAAQTRLFTALTQTPFATLGWTAGGGGRTATLSYALAGYDDEATTLLQPLVLAHGLLGQAPAATQAGIWDGGPVVVVRRPGVLVLAHPAQRSTATTAADLEAGVLPAVSRAWGRPWAGRAVLLVPGSEAERDRLLGARGTGDVVADQVTAPGRSGDHDQRVAGDRIVLGAAATSAGRVEERVLLAHETLHLAARADTGAAVPRWLVEGAADEVAYAVTGVPPARSAPELAADVDAGRLPSALPGDAGFDASGAAIERAYEQGASLCRLVVARVGPAGLSRLYGLVGDAAPGSDAGAATDDALRQVLGTDRAGLLAQWRAWLRAGGR